ncbi:recombinase family protein [Actinomadura geliboluensis]|uniref:recombinase family protein n=1 Tax=Actinomadura geliboluensis TaxID=882440 RepID=UPI0037140A02
MPLIIRPSRSEPHGQARRTPRRPAAGRLARLECARPGDTLVVPSPDRLSRSLQDLITIVAGLRECGVGFRSLHEAIDATTPGGRLVFHVFAALAEFVRELIVEGTREGLDAARALLTRPGESVSSIARLNNISRSTLYEDVSEAKGGPAPFRCPPPCQEIGTRSKGHRDHSRWAFW